MSVLPPHLLIQTSQAGQVKGCAHPWDHGLLHPQFSWPSLHEIIFEEKEYRLMGQDPAISPDHQISPLSLDLSDALWPDPVLRGETINGS